MSFSSDIKQELNKNSNLSNKELVKNELIGYLISGNTNIINQKEIKFSTESDYNINRFSKLLSNLDINHKIEVSRKSVYYYCKNKRDKLAFDTRWTNYFRVRKRIQRRKFKSHDSRSLYGLRLYERSQ